MPFNAKRCQAVKCNRKNLQKPTNRYDAAETAETFNFQIGGGRHLTMTPKQQCDYDEPDDDTFFSFRFNSIRSDENHSGIPMAARNDVSITIFVVFFFGVFNFG